jgi:hypothetical protein
VRIDRSTALAEQGAVDGGASPGIYPYLGPSVGSDGLQNAIATCGAAVVRGMGGARLAAKTAGVLVDPAVYESSARQAQNDLLWPCDEWLDRQRAAGVPLLLTDSTRIRKGDREALRSALGRWNMIEQPTLVVLPIESWWLKGGLACLTEEVRAAGRQVGLVLLHHYNGLDSAGAIAGLLTFMAAVGGHRVVLLRCDVSAIGAVAYGAFAGFIGMSASTRHGPLPMRLTSEADMDGERDETPAVLVPTLHDYFKASRLPAFAQGEQDVLRCDYPCCRGESLLRVTRLYEVDPAIARSQAYMHNVATHEHVARRVLGAGEPRDAWWECCKAGADAAASLIETGITLSVSPWQRQWLELGSPSHDPVTVG